MAIWLCKEAGVPIDRYLRLNDIEPFETLLDASISVVSSRVGNKFVRVSKEITERTRLYLYHVDTEIEKLGMVSEIFKVFSMLVIFAKLV